MILGQMPRFARILIVALVLAIFVFGIWASFNLVSP